MQSLGAPTIKATWLTEVIAARGFVQRNYVLTKRYVGWELVWLLYTIGNAVSIGASVDAGSGGKALTVYLLIGALIWSCLSSLFDLLSETMSWERWEGTIEDTFMSAASRATHLLGTSVHAITYGLLRTSIVFGISLAFFDLDIDDANFFGAALVLAVCRILLIGVGIIAAVMPLLSPEKGTQVTFIFGSLLLLISGVYYEVDVLPGWMQALARYSPATYALRGIRGCLLDGRATGDLWPVIWPVLTMGAITPSLVIRVFQRAERFAKRTGRPKRNG